MNSAEWAKSNGFDFSSGVVRVPNGHWTVPKIDGHLSIETSPTSDVYLTGPTPTQPCVLDHLVVSVQDTHPVQASTMHIVLGGGLAVGHLEVAGVNPYSAPTPEGEAAPLDVILQSGASAGRVTVRGCWCRVRGEDVPTVELINSRVEFQGFPGPIPMAVSGACEIKGAHALLSSISSSTLTLGGRTEQFVTFDRVEDESLVVRVVEGTRVSVLAGSAVGVKFEVLSGELLVDADLRDAVFEGPSRITVRGNARLVRPAFAKDPSLEVQTGGRVSGATGRLTELSLAPRSAFLGEADKSVDIEAFSFTGTGSKHAAELEGVSVYALDSAALDAIDEATYRFRPWFEPNRRRRRALEAEMAHGRDADDEVRRRRAVAYWARLDDLLDRQRVHGDLKSRARESHIHSRYRAASIRRSHWSRERAVLALYRLVGYGEQISRPLSVHAGLSFLIAIALTFDELGRPTATMFARLLFAPLSLIKDDLQPPLTCLRDQILYGVGRAVGVALVATSILAARRLARGSE